ncbi:MAG: 16S rRNA (uracil(1498)-N(3))-methyltransferase [Spirochaetales bacterium]|nr:16S rRNA (uracil(1498)-N(3))-methyltransferase [Spirochaetales bacterium]
MKQFVLPESYNGEKLLTLRKDTFHHLVRVLRLRPEETLKGIDHNRTIHTFRVQDIQKDRCVIEKTDTLKPEVREYQLTLFQGLLKGKKFTQVVRQATEAGIHRVVPLVSEHSIPRLEAQEEKTWRLQRVAKEAVEQSGSPEIPEIAEPLPIEDLEAFWNHQGLGLYCHNEDQGGESLHRLLASPQKHLAVCVGPEGGWSEKDRKTLERAGFHPLYLGFNTLRAETAALYALAVMHFILMEKESWIPKPR